MPFRRLVVGVVALLAWGLVETTPVRAAETLSPSAPSFSYDAGPYTNINVGGLLIGSCEVPEGCDNHEFTVDIPDGYYEALREQGKVGVVEIAASWPSNEDDFDLGLLDKDGNPIATSGFGNSDFERIEFTELPSGEYTIQMAVFRVANSSFHMDVRLRAMDPTPTSAASTDGGMRFSNGTPVALERSSGEPNVEIAPNGAVFVDMPLGAGTNSILYKSTDNSQTFKPMAPYHPNNNPLPNNVAGGGDSYTAIDPEGRICFSELNTLLSLGIGCSTDGGKTFAADPAVIDPATPLVDRQWQAATPEGEQFISAQYGIVTAGESRPGIRVHKETPKGSNQFVKVADVDTGLAMKSYNMVADTTDTEGGGTVVQAYLRSNQGADKLAKPHQLAVWQSTDGGTTVTTHTVANLDTTPGNNFASLDIDRAGNVYVSWSEQGTWDIFYSVAKKGDLDNWSAPVRVNLEPVARTAIQPTIRVGDAGRVFLGFYAAEQYGNPDALTGGEWHAFMAYSTDGDCQLDGSCGAGGTPRFHQTRISDHVLQHRGICLGGTGCGGDPYYGDRSMLEFLDIAFHPETGQAHVITTDSSRTNQNTTITMYRQVSGPSAWADAGDVSDVNRVGVSASAPDPDTDGEWPYESPAPSQKSPAADILGVALSRPDEATLRVTMNMVDVSGFQQALQAGVGSELLVATRFATALDVFYVGMRVGPDGEPAFEAGHLTPNGLIDVYGPDDDVTVNGTIDEAAKTIVMDVKLADLKTVLQQPDTVEEEPPVVQGVKNGDPLFAVTGFSLVGLESASDPMPKHWMDVAPAFNVPASVNTSTVPAPGGGGSGGGGGPHPATGGDGAGAAAQATVALMVIALALAVARRRTRTAV